jgi:putative endopeptidase
MVRMSAIHRAISVCVEALLIAGTALSTGAPIVAQESSLDPPSGHITSPSGLELPYIDLSVNPCSDFYEFACGNFERNNPIPADQPANSPAYLLYNSIAEELHDIVLKAAVGSFERTPNEQKVGDFYAACLDTKTIESKKSGSVRLLLHEINEANKSQLGVLVGKLQRIGVNVFFSYGQMQDLKDPSSIIATIDQGSLGLPERDYYFRNGDKDKTLREQYVAHIATMLSLSGEGQAGAASDAQAVLALETLLARASQTVRERRTPENMYHMESVSRLKKSIPEFHFEAFLDAVHSPHVTELNVANPGYMLAIRQAILTTPLRTLQAYMRYEVLTAFALELPSSVDEEDFDFNRRKIIGEPQQLPRWKRCSTAVDAAVGEALGQIYVQRYFAGDAKAKTLEMVHDIENAMEEDLNQIAWMSPFTKAHAEDKLHALTNKIGYPEIWRDYSTLKVVRLDALGNQERAAAFENDRQLSKIGKPVDSSEWAMTPPTLNAYYDLRMNNINFPAGMLQHPFFSRESDPALNYGHIGTIMGHELTHAFDDQGSQFDSKGAFVDWWSSEDKSSFEARTGCLVDEYNKFAVDDLHVNGRLTLGENTADNGGVLLAFMAYMERAKRNGLDIDKKVDGYTGAQRFYIAFAQNWCENMRPEQARNQLLTDPHSPNHVRVNGVLANQPEFSTAFGCQKGSPLVPANVCRVW